MLLMLLPREAREVLLLALLAAFGCQRGQPAWQQSGELPGLTSTTVTVAEPTADAVPETSQVVAPVVVSRVRRVLSATRPLLERHITVTEPGEQTFPLSGHTDPWFGVQSGEARLRDARGNISTRPTQLLNGRSASAVVKFAADDVGVAYDLTVTASLPWPPLHAETEEFVVPRQAHVRFGVALQVPDAPFVPTRGHFQVSLKRKAGPATSLYEGDIERDQPQHGVGWQDIELDLSPYAGQAVQFVFETRREVDLQASGARLPVPLFSQPFLVGSSARTHRRNLLLISIDTLRADHVGAYAYPRPTSPLIDHLAATGTLFENAFAVFAETSASHMTLFTSLYPSVHGVSITQWGNRALPTWQATLAETLTQHHYITAAMTEDGLLGHSLGFARGFTDYVEFRKPATYVSAAAVAEHVFGTGAQWIRTHRNDLFFLFLHTYQVHERVARGAAYDRLRSSFEHDGLPAENNTGAAMMRDYDVSIRYTDDALASVISALEDLHLSNDTLVVITSDHGEEFGTHGVYGHGANLSDFALHVPLILWSPGFIPAGRRVATQVGLIDVLPTLLDLLELPPLAQAEGHSWAPEVRGGPEGAPRPLFFERGDTLRAVRYPDYKVTWNPGDSDARAEYYDLRRDPGEAESATDAEDTIRQSIALMQRHDNDATAHREQLASAAGSIHPAAVPLDAQTKERLRALGYNVQP